MKTFFKKIFFPIYVFFRKKDPVIKAKIEEVLKSYDVLIKQYELIQQRKSGLSANQRRKVEAQVKFLIAKGHIKVNL